MTNNINKIRTILPRVSFNCEIPKNVMALNVNDDNIYYNADNSLYKVQTNSTYSISETKRLSIYGLCFKIIKTSCLVNKNLSDYKIMNKFPYTIISKNIKLCLIYNNIQKNSDGEYEFIVTGIDDAYHYNYDNENLIWYPSLNGNDGINNFKNVYPFCLMKKYYKTENDSFCILDENHLNEEQFVRLPIFFKSVTFNKVKYTDESETELKNSIHEKEEFSYFWMSPIKFKLSDSFKETHSYMFKDFWPVESHQVNNNLKSNGSNYIENIFISAFNISNKLDGITYNEAKPNGIAKFNLNTFDETTKVPFSVYESYLEFVWSIKLGTPFIQFQTNRLLKQLYNKTINYSSLHQRDNNLLFNNDEIVCSIDCDSKNIIIINDNKIYDFKSDEIINISFHYGTESTNKKTYNYSAIVKSYDFISKSLTIKNEKLFDEIKNILPSNEFILDVNTIITRNSFITGKTNKVNLKDGLYDDVFVMDNIENPHIFSVLPTSCNTMKLVFPDVVRDTNCGLEINTSKLQSSFLSEDTSCFNYCNRLDYFNDNNSFLCGKTIKYKKTYESSVFDETEEDETCTCLAFNKYIFDNKQLADSISQVKNYYSVINYINENTNYSEEISETIGSCAQIFCCNIKQDSDIVNKYNSLNGNEHIYFALNRKIYFC